MTSVFHFILALAIICCLALLFSNDRKKIRPRVLLQLVVIEGAAGLVLPACHRAD